ncbi:hypothetical protein PBI_APPA_5 [Microbacterium phage Appa]|uniref:Uncharacterized protein n=1 Tax=Microbacterium phage Appa TaxID=2182350 RepID=A0A2U8UHP8_9CAUD|nr:hypothetical protein HOT26_gp05 [Microbacterium phage Appa]AWN03187.1 hypothetical protein PBI_APPA_5 [Microbacterium phage Appa]URM87269.1 hypothetical protein SEA_ANTUNA_5 [Microbacterium phage Antuna]WNM67643.1 hypothetical protein SEA_DROPSHOT_5 [Microbacterium phage Dropshot]
MWVAEITLRVRIGRKREQQHEHDETNIEPPSMSDVSGSQVELSDQPIATLARPIGFHPAPEDAARSAMSTPTLRRER